MKSPYALLFLCSALAAGPAVAQTQPKPPPYCDLKVFSPSGDAAPVPSDDRALKPRMGAPNLTPADALKPPTIDLPHEPIEPYLLTKANGPFMVLARAFRGVDAEAMALALVKELRTEHNLPAYILRTKDLAPGIKMPEKVRTFDEAVVLVGNEKNGDDQEKLLRRVKKIKPKCLAKMATPFPWREGQGLARAYRMTSPYAPTQLLSHSIKDRLVAQMNGGLRSVVNCPGRYSLQVAEFSGRSTVQFNASQTSAVFQNLKESPLQTAHYDAERLADKLAKDSEFQRLGQPVYVLHDRTASRVYVGSFDSPNDAKAGATRERLMLMAYPLANKSDPAKVPGARGKSALDTMIVPALALFDLSDIKAKIQQ